ncbi:alpha/beta hydrolase [soil metagenome]
MTLAYTTVGNGPTLVIGLHSWLADHQTFMPMAPYLDKSLYTFVFPDFRGYGKSRDQSGAYDIREIGRDVIELAETLARTRGTSRYHLLGHSMGGQAAQWIAGQPGASERLASVILLSSVPDVGFPLDEQGAAFFGAAATSAEVRAQCASAVTGGRLGAGFAEAMSRLSIESAPADTIAAYLKAWTTNDVSAEIAPYGGAVTVLFGDCDPVLTEQVTRDKVASRYGDCAVKPIPGSGHYPSMETPAYTAAIVCEALAASPTRTR